MWKLYVVNTFTDHVFSGNPAAVCILDHWPQDSLLLKITRENALSHTAFVVPQDQTTYELRWFTPSTEIDLCGHATLAAAYVLNRFHSPQVNYFSFLTKSGILTVTQEESLFVMDLPAYKLKALEVTEELTQALGERPREVWRARDLVCIFDRAEQVEQLNPDLNKLLQLKGALVQVTAPGSGDFDCVSRTFAPKMGLPEDPVCGSGHCHIIPYWANKWNKTEFTARQASPRGGTLYCRLRGDRVLLGGHAALYSVCELVMEGLT